MNLCNPLRIVTLAASCAGLCALGPVTDVSAAAESPPAKADAPAPVDVVTDLDDTQRTILDDFTDALIHGKPTLDLRLRFEHVHDESPSPGGGRRGQGYAFTERLRLGYATKPLHGFSVFAELEDIRTASKNHYDDTVNGNTSEAVIADPPDTELNQGYLKYEHDDLLTFIGGRQRIKLDDDRFVGNVGWRQNEQTFDAVSVRVNPLEGLSVFYGYVFNVNRIFGPDADADFQSDSHLVNASYTVAPWATVTAFAYLLDFDNSPANSSNTFGFRVTGSHAFDDTWSAGYVGSFAHQRDAGNNMTDYAANYYLVDGSVTRKGWGTAGVGYEVLGSDDGAASFRTPLATLHAFNGWADVFLATPPNGLRDLYVYAGTTLPWDVKGKVVYHYFHAADDNTEFGHEFDIVFSKAINKHISILAKYADFFGDSTFADRRKVWLQMEIKF